VSYFTVRDLVASWGEANATGSKDRPNIIFPLSKRIYEYTP